MNTQEINSLTGRELDVAVALYNGYSWYAVEPDLCIVRSDSELMHPSWKRISEDDVVRADDWDTYIPHYSTDMAASWSLDDGHFTWGFYEDRPVGGRVLCNVLTNPITGKVFEAVETFRSLEDKPRAYATARCRAWLKARLAIESE